jgi:hypothetical protein
MLPNPDFGKTLRIQQHKLACKGLRLGAAQGLESITITGLEIGSKNGSTIEQVREWFRFRGAKTGP